MKKPKEDKSIRQLAVFSAICPECESLFEKRLKRNPQLKREDDDMMAVVSVDFNDEWIFELKIDCDSTDNHLVRIQGAWSNPIVRCNMNSLGISKRDAKANAAKIRKEQAIKVIPIDVIVRKLLNNEEQAES